MTRAGGTLACQSDLVPTIQRRFESSLRRHACTASLAHELTKLLGLHTRQRTGRQRHEVLLEPAHDFAQLPKTHMHVVPGVVRPIRVLWNEVIGFVFIVLVVFWARPVYRIVRDLRTAEGSLWDALLAIGLFLLMAYFGITSFLRARRISRS